VCGGLGPAATLDGDVGEDRVPAGAGGQRLQLGEGVDGLGDQTGSGQGVHSLDETALPVGPGGADPAGVDQRAGDDRPRPLVGLAPRQLHQFLGEVGVRERGRLDPVAELLGVVRDNGGRSQVQVVPCPR
jgi:hypothetical protein